MTQPASQPATPAEGRTSSHYRYRAWNRQLGKADAAISSGVDGIASCIDATHEVIAQTVGGGVVGVAGTAVSGNAEATCGGNVNTVTAGVDTSHVVASQALEVV